MPSHHPSEALLIGYAAGSTSESEALALSAHLTYCPLCRDRLNTAEAMGGYLLEQADAAPMQTDALQNVLNRLDEQEPVSPTASTPHLSLAGVPAPLVPYANAALRMGGWRWIAPGIQQLPLLTTGRAKARLMRFKSGVVLPEHSHQGQELTVVLSGSYCDKLGHFGPGDMADLDDTVLHQPMVDSKEACIALIVTERPLKYSGWMARLVQPVIGI